MSATSGRVKTNLLIGFYGVTLVGKHIYFFDFRSFWGIFWRVKSQNMVPEYYLRRPKEWTDRSKDCLKRKIKSISWLPRELFSIWRHQWWLNDVIKIVGFSHNSRNSQNFWRWKSADNELIGPNLIKIFKICITKNILQKFHANPTCHSRVITYVLFLEHLR